MRGLPQPPAPQPDRRVLGPRPSRPDQPTPQQEAPPGYYVGAGGELHRQRYGGRIGPGIDVAKHTFALSNSGELVAYPQDGGKPFAWTQAGEFGKDWTVVPSTDPATGQTSYAARVTFGPVPLKLPPPPSARIQEQQFGLPPGAPGTIRGNFAQVMNGDLIKGTLGALSDETGQPTVAGRALGALGGAAIGGMIVPVFGHIVGGVIGALHPEVLDVVRDTVERGIGTASQISGAITDPEKFGQVNDVLANFGATWQAARLTYESAPFYVAGGVQTFQDPDHVFVDYDLPTVTGGLSAVVEARRRIAAGEDATRVHDEITARFGTPGVMRELASGIFLDPINFYGRLTQMGTRVVARATRNATLAQAARVTRGPVNILRAYRELLIAERPMREGFEAARDLTAFQRLLVGRTVLNVVEKGEYTPPKGILGLFRLDPVSEARDEVIQSGGFLEAHLSRLPDDELAPQRIQQAIHGLTGAAVERPDLLPGADEITKASATLRGRVVRRFLNEDVLKSVDDKVSAWNATTDVRRGLNELAEALGDTHPNIIKRLGTAADDVLDQFTQRTGRAFSVSGQDAAASAKAIAEMFKDGKVPYTPQMFKAHVGITMAEAAGRWAETAFGVKPNSLAKRVFAATKNVQSIFLLGANPAYLMQNIINGELTSLLDRSFGLFGKGTVQKELQRLGVTPARLLEAFTSADMENGQKAAGALQNFFAQPGLEVLTGAVGKGEAGSLTDKINRGAQRILRAMPTTALGRRTEAWQSARTTLVGMRRWRASHWVAGVGFDNIPQDVAAALDNFAPGTSRRVYGAIESGLNAGERRASLFGPMAGNPKVEQYLGDIAQRFGTDEARVRDLLATEGLGARFNQMIDDLGRPATVDDIRRIVSGIRDEAEEAMTAAEQADLSSFLQYSDEAAKLGDTGELMNVLDDVRLREYETFASHMHNLDLEWDAIQNIADDALRSKSIQAMFARSKVTWERLRKYRTGMYGAVDDGLRRSGMKLDDSFSAALRRQDDLYQKFFDFRDEALRNVFEGKRATPEAWRSAQEKIDKAYTALIDDISTATRTTDDYMAAAFGRHYGERAGQQFIAWRKHWVGAERADMDRVLEFRRATRDLTRTAKHNAFRRFHEEREARRAQMAADSIARRRAIFEDMPMVQRDVPPIEGILARPLDLDRMVNRVPFRRGLLRRFPPATQFFGPDEARLALSDDIADIVRRQVDLDANAEYQQLSARLWQTGVPPEELNAIRQRMAAIDDVLRPTRATPTRKLSDLSNLPIYVQDEIRRNYSIADRLGIVDDIEDSAANGLVANQIADNLRRSGRLPATLDMMDIRNVVRSVRNRLGIPSQDEPAEFAKWLNEYRTRATAGVTPLHPDLERVRWALSDAADDIARIEAAAVAGALPDDMRLADDLAVVAERLAAIRQAGRPVQEFLSSPEAAALSDFQRVMLADLDGASRSGRKMSAMLRAYGDAIQVPTSATVASALGYVDEPEKLLRHKLPGNLSDSVELAARQMIDELAAGQPGRRLFLEGGEVSGIPSTLPDWYSDLSARYGVKRDQVFKALDQIVADAGRDKGITVERLKSAILGRMAEGFETPVGRLPPDPEALAVLKRPPDEIEAAYQAWEAIGQPLPRPLQPTLPPGVTKADAWAQARGAAGYAVTDNIMAGMVGDVVPTARGDAIIRAVDNEAVTIEIGGQTQRIRFVPEGDPPYPPGAFGDMGQPPMPWAQGLEQARYKNVFPILDELGESMIRDIQNPPLRGLGQLPREVSEQLGRYLDKVEGQWGTHLHLETRWGEITRDMSLLNYGRRYVYNTYLGAIAPYEFWTTQSMIKWGMRVLNNPGIAAEYYRMNNFFHDQVRRNNFPSRLEGRIKIPLPFLPDWMGGGVWIDPLRVGLPLQTWQAPWEDWQENQSRVAQKAEQVLSDMLQANEITPQEYEQALTGHAGDVWDRATQTAVESDQTLKRDAYDLFSSILAPSVPLNWAIQTLRGTPERISPLPITRMYMATKGLMGFDGKDDIVTQLHRRLGLPIFDQWHDYRVDRELSNMAAMGLITAQQAQEAMLAKEGDVYEMAFAREAFSNAVGFFGGAAFGTGAQIFPEGEQTQRNLAILFRAARHAETNGDTRALEKFFEDHPEFEARLALYQNPEDRMRNFLIDALWTRYNELPSVYKDDLKDALGPDFDGLFVDKATRDYSLIPMEALQKWAVTLGQRIPGGPDDIPPLPIEWAHPAVARDVDEYYRLRQEMFDWESLRFEQERYFRIPKDERVRRPVPRAVRAFLAQRDDLFPNIEATLTEFNALPSGRPRRDFKRGNPQVQAYYDFLDQARASDADLKYWFKKGQFRSRTRSRRSEFLDSVPDLGKYWDWRRDYLETHAHIQPYLDEQKEARQQEEAGIATGIMPRDLHRVATAYLFNDRPLSPATSASLMRLYMTSGTGEPFNSWLTRIVAESEAYLPPPTGTVAPLPLPQPTQ